MKVTGLINMFKNRAHREELYSKAEFWDSKAEELQGHAVSMWPNNHLNILYHSEQMDLVESSISNIAGMDILDVGCGTGRLSQYLGNKGAKVTGIDFSPNAIQIANKENLNNKISFEVMSVFEMNYVEEFDYVFLWGCITVATRNEQEVADVLSNIERSLKPGGKLLLLEPIHKGFLHRVLDMSIDEFCRLLNDKKLTVTHVKQMHFWPARLLLAFVSWPKSFTILVYRFGQNLMKLPWFKSMGDYKVVLAKKQ